MQVLDCLTIWKQRCLKYNDFYQFVYHTEIFVPFDMDNTILCEMLFIQAVSDVRQCKYPCTEIDRITLLALAMKAEHGDDMIDDQELQ